MSAAAAREPARGAEVARHYLRLLARERGAVSFAFAAAIAVLGTLNTMTFAGLALPVGLAFFFPLFQWRDRGWTVLDEAMPLDFAAHRRIRAACGAAWAALVLAACVGGYTALLAVALHGLGGFPAWYPALLFGWGLAFYCFGMATWLRAERPGRVLVLVFFAAATPTEWLPGRWTDGVAGVATAAELAARPAWAWLAPCAVALVVSCVAVWVAASPGLRLPRLRPGLARRSAAAERAGAPAAAAPGPRRPPGLARVLWSELAMVGHDAVWALALALLAGLSSLQLHFEGTPGAAARHLPLAGRSEGLSFLAMVAFFWPLLVWMNELGPGRTWAEAVPVDTAWRRALRLLAGAAWLEAMVLVVEAETIGGAWRAGVISSLAQVPMVLWVGFPAAVLILYLLGSIPLLVSVSHPVRRTVVWYFAFTFLIVLPAVLTLRWRLSPAAVVLLANLIPRPHWGEALLLWLPVVAAFTVWMLRVGVARDRGQGSPDTFRAAPAGAR